ncbi:MAG: DapH/DapD/GlmU-related protein [Phycisphaerae bacterium]
MEIIRKILWRWANLYTHLTLSKLMVSRTDSVRFIGFPILKLVPGSHVNLADEVTLISNSYYTPLGINHPVVLATLQPGATILLGERVGMSGGSICAARSVAVGNDTLLGANVTITDTDFHPLAAQARQVVDFTAIGVAPVSLGRRVFVGTNCIILKGVAIGDNSIIGAGSVVTKSIPANVIAAGNPCRVIRELTSAELAS